jgi:hypothetical protein
MLVPKRDTRQRKSQEGAVKARVAAAHALVLFEMIKLMMPNWPGGSPHATRLASSRSSAVQLRWNKRGYVYMMRKGCPRCCMCCAVDDAGRCRHQKNLIYGQGTVIQVQWEREWQQHTAVGVAACALPDDAKLAWRLTTRNAAGI